MRILWFTWKDKKHPLAGGAEMVAGELGKRLVRDGHELTFLVGSFAGCKKSEMIDGYKVIRLGNRYTVHFLAMIYYLKNLREQFDLVIDEVNTAPFFASWYMKSGKLRHFLFFHQLAREIWFYQMPFPFSPIGYLAEAIYLRLLASRIRLSTLWTLQTFDPPKVITVSKSTKKDLMRYGFKKENIGIISEGIGLRPVEKLESCKVMKYAKPTILSFGAVRAMKRTDHIVKAFELIKSGRYRLSTLRTFDFKDLRLIVSGDANDKYGKKVLKMINSSPFKDSIEVFGKVSDEKRMELMQRSHLICVASVKEGWGLIVTEANSQGTPAVVYDADGLRDSVRNNETGLVCDRNTPENLAEKIEALLRDEQKYEKMRTNAWQWSKKITFEKSYEDFKKALGIK